MRTKRFNTQTHNRVIRTLVDPHTQKYILNVTVSNLNLNQHIASCSQCRKIHAKRWADAAAAAVKK